MKTVFITGATGYIGTRLVKRLIKKDYSVIALVRKGSEHKVPTGATVIVADPLDENSFGHLIPSQSVFVQLLGVPHPSPAKAKQFRNIDLVSVKASATAAARAAVSHFIYLSVAMTPSKLMKDYQQVRKEGELFCQEKKLNLSFIRPWYVIGPGHWWPLLLTPFYGIAELVPSWRKKARAMGLVSINQMLGALEQTVNSDPAPLRILEIKDIKNPKTV